MFVASDAENRAISRRIARINAEHLSQGLVVVHRGAEAFQDAAVESLVDVAPASGTSC